MTPDHQHRGPAQVFCKKIILKSAYHYAIREQFLNTAQPKEQAPYKNPERNINIIQRNVCEHIYGLCMPVNAKRIAFGNIRLGHFNIAITQHASYKCFVMGSRKGRHNSKTNEYEKCIQNFTV